MTLSVIFYPYHVVRAILSNAILSVYHFVHTILSVPFCPLPFCPRFILIILYPVKTDVTVLPEHSVTVCSRRTNQSLTRESSRPVARISLVVGQKFVCLSFH